MNLIFASTIRRKRSVAALFVALLLPSAMCAQSMDYGALEQLFKEPVTTSVDGSPQRVSDVPATMEIITAEDIRRSGAKDIPGVLRHVSGIDTMEWGNDNVDVSIRGYDQAYSPRLLVLVDGRQVYSDDFGYVPWSAVPVELAAIRQIEIIKGPNSALFGFNAVGGVINIITYNPLYDKVNAVSSTGGTQELAAGSGVGTYKFGSRAAVRLSAGGHSDSDFSTPIPVSEDVSARQHQYRDAVDLNSIFRLNDKMQLSFEANHSASRQSDMQPVYQLDITQHGANSIKGQFTAESGFGLLQATAYTNWTTKTSTPGLLNQPFYFKNRLTVAEVQDTFRVGVRHILRAAIEYRNSTESSTPTAGANVDYGVFSVSGMWSWKITSALSLTNALRLDLLSLGREGFLPPGYPFTNSDWNRTLTQPNFNSGIVWKPSDTNSLRFMVSRGAVLPNLSISGAFLLVSPYLNISGTPFLKPSVVTNYEIGWDHVMPRLHILFRADAFHQRSANLLTVGGGFVLAPGGPYSLTSNAGSSDATGVEVGLRSALLKNYRWSVDYRPEWISDHLVPAAQGGAAFLDYQHTTPLHLVKANLGWANKRWEMDGYLQYHSGTSGLVPTAIAATLIPVASFVALDGRIAYNVTNWATWAVSGQNLTHASQVQTSGPAVERRVLGTMSIHF